MGTTTTGATVPVAPRTPYPWYVMLAGSLVLGIAATAGQVHPTDYTRWDVFLVGISAATVIFCATEAPWWTLALVATAAGAAAGYTGDALPTALAVVALVLAVVTVRYWLPIASGVSAALSIAALSRLEYDRIFGLTSVFSLVLIVVLLFTSLNGQTKVVRRSVYAGLTVFILVFLLGAAGFGASALKAADAVSRGNDAARRGIASLKDGDFDNAATLFRRASVAFTDAEQKLGGTWSKFGRLVPVVAQNRATALRVVHSAAEVAVRADAAATNIDPDALRVRNGRVDLAAVTAIAAPVDQLRRAILDLQATLGQPVSAWVPSVITDRLADVRGDVDRYRGSIDHLSAAVHAAPGLLGSERPRHYFVAFSQPAESRGIGGFIGNYAILTTDQGAITMSEFGRSNDLVDAAPDLGLDVELPADFLARYGEFNFQDPVTGLVQPLAWKNIGLSPDFPTMTDVVARMWQATFGTPIDGAILIDPYTMAKLLEYTGPQTLDGVSGQITAGNAAEFILRTQYQALQQDARVDLLETLARQTVDSLLAGALPAPMAAAEDLGPYVAAHRLMMFTTDATEQAMFDDVGLSGRFPLTEGDADFAVTFNNAGPNKLDAYLTHDITAVSRTDDELGIDVVDVTITLTNTAPAEGLSEFIAGNSSGFPIGTNYLYLSVYGTVGVADATRDDVSLGVSTDSELGTVVAATYVDIAPGATTTVVVTFQAPAGGERPGGWRVFVAPTAQRDPNTPAPGG